MSTRLTPRERFALLVIDEKPDRCNIIPLITSHAAYVAGMPLKQYYTNGESMARAQIAALETYSHDALSIFSEVGIIAEAMGSVFDYPDNDLPVLKRPVLTRCTAHELKVPQPHDGRLSVYLEAIEYAYRALADRVPIFAYVPAPFTTGMMLSDPNVFLALTIKDPGTLHMILQKALDAAIEFCYHIINAGGLPILVDPLASSSVISPKAYKDFALPYERALINFLHRYDFDVILHICGDTTPILHLLPETTADLVSLDQVDLSLALASISRTMRIIGNFNTSLLAFSSPEEIHRRVRDMVALGKTSLKGFVAATGCEVPIRTPQENVRAFIRAAEEVGWYWE